MPDLIESHIFVTGPTPDILRFRNSHFGANESAGRNEFEFGSFMPMPEILGETEIDTESDLALVALGVDDHGEAACWLPTFDEVFQFGWVKAAGIHSRQGLLTHLEQHAPTAVLAARKRIAAYRQTGYYDWQAWRLANWGTKWGPSSTAFVADRADLLEFTFCTPWCFPEPAFRKLGLLYPELCFDIAATNPDLNISVLGHVSGNVVSLEPVDEPGEESESPRRDEKTAL